MIFHNILFLFKKIIFSLQHVFTAGAGFSKIPRKYETVVFIIKILETGKNVFKCNFRIIKNKKKYYEICVSTRSAALRLLCHSTLHWSRFRGNQVGSDMFKQRDLNYTWWTIKGFKGTVVNLCMEGHLKLLLQTL